MEQGDDLLDALSLRICNLIRFSSLDFNELLSLTWGISPPDLEEALSKLIDDSIIARKGNHYQLIEHKRFTLIPNTYPENKQFINAAKKTETFISKLPIPHPHDFDWRFSVKGIRSFVEHILSYHHTNHSIGVIAAPTLYSFLRYLNHFPMLSLIERSEIMVESIRTEFGDASGVMCHDLQYPWPSRIMNEFDCIVMDPPWYQNYYELFLLRATEILAPAGLIHTAFFPPFTKTHAINERSAILSFAHNRGLHLIELKSGCIEYESPQFERQAFTIDGCEACNNWRKGDIVSLYFGMKYDREHVFQVETGDWREFIVGRSKVKVRDDGRKYEAPELTTVEKDSPFLSSIKRSYPGRELIGLWTSCQQAYKVKGAYVVSKMLDCILDGKNLEQTMVEVSILCEIDEVTVERDCLECYKTLVKIVNTEKETQNHDSKR
jgi:hypothetical protein